MVLMKILIFLLCLLIKSLNVHSGVIFQDPCRSKYVVIVDGGSSGTRLHVFEFETIKGRPKLIVTNRFKSKIALSKFSGLREDWSLMRFMIENLTFNALSVIPEQCVNETSIHVQVTAGVRQIDQRMSNKILHHIREILSKTRFDFKPKFVSILSTLKEGTFAWISINFLLNKLQETNASSANTIGMLDLGGGSTQISFATLKPELLSKTVKVQLFGHEYNVYTAGYDYMGINEMRIKYLNAQNCLQSTCQNQIARSQCIHPNIKASFNFGNRTLIIGGKPISRNRRFCYCFGKGLRMIKSISPIRQYYEEMEFIAISAYYYILKAVGNILTKTENGLFKTSIRDIIMRAIEICQDPKKYKLETYEHFLCLDMSYLVALLHNGYRYEWYDKLSVALKIKEISLSWALGYAISIL